ncbi:hypothetical protein [Staphylococcus pseudintermedius]|uniref:hypothetical protein n=1 Tax=Staphylococcus pseudintermedius TaxID=283734 RepID=UPI0013EF03A5|nr:hypothetical protein [Staphylococcus pseudintermedius]EIS6532889.1 hypothetical protein [Staphylococcus pseudintermedius]EJL1410740.1 hypothetical protein [Staphylococcus pseudintermedius]ELV2646858.1 hypothetical protein [Staphylococcus pseudintermedius]ELV3391881.1 hypothetical protein [Staphylococcus pseudintermedius]MDE9954755.1 hypothetical protein [Staphylococcus pseudintermedius]
MWNFIKGLFKFLFVSTLVITGVVGVGLAVLTYVFKKDFEEIESKTKEIIADIEAKQG